MAIVKLLKFKLYGLSEEKNQVIDMLYNLKLVHIKDLKKVDGLTKQVDENELMECDSKIQRVQKIIDYYQNLSDNKVQNEILVNELDFVNFETTHQNILFEVDEISDIIRLEEEKSNYFNEIKNENQLETTEEGNENEKRILMEIFSCKYQGNNFDKIKESLYLFNTVSVECDGKKDEFMTAVCENEANQLRDTLKEFSVTVTSTEQKYVDEELYDNYIKNLDEYETKNAKNVVKTYENDLDLFKVYYDYLCSQKQKIEINKDFGFTQKTFALEGYVERDKKQQLEDLISANNLSVSYEFSKPKESDDVPTKTQNKKLVKPFEFVTNMYSVPKYGEIDPNFFVGFFFSLFFGFIMADIGYGIVLLMIGLFLSLKKNSAPGLKALMKVVAIGGACAVIFGLLFGSFFGYTNENMTFIPKGVLPDPSKNVMLYLIASVAIGAFQIMVSFLLKGILLIRRGKFATAICSAFAWDVFFIGATLFILDFTGVTTGLKTIGLVVTLVGIGTAVLGNILINKGFDRIAKSFGSLYSILNLFSDLLSYTRLFGLMLSGVIIATIVNQLASSFYLTLWKIPFGVLISLIGHTFNVAMGALGAYIHDARLQYIEFFSRFYEGEGELFTPFGSNFSYIKLIKVED